MKGGCANTDDPPFAIATPSFKPYAEEFLVLFLVPIVTIVTAVQLPEAIATGWLEYRQQARSLSGSVVEVITYLHDTSHVLHRVRRALKRGESCFLLEVELASLRAAVKNPYYGFRVARAQGTRSGWVVTEITRDAEFRDTSGWIEYVAAGGLFLYWPAHDVERILKDAEITVEAEGDLTLLQFRRPDVHPTEFSDGGIVDGRLWLDPANRFCIVRSDCTFVLHSATDYRVKVPFRLEGVHSYAANGTIAQRVLKLYRPSAGDPKEDGISTHTYTLSSESYPASDFTLTAFGLPEPFGIEWERPTPWWLYALFSAGVLFVVAVIVSFWKRRLAARQAG